MSSDETQTAERTTWQIDPVHSQVEFGVRHMMLSTVKGHFSELEGSILADEDEPTGARVDVSIEAASVDTRNQDRDTHLRSADFFDVENHSTIRFRSTGVEEVGEGLRVEGELTIRGTTRPVALEVEKLGGGIDPWGNERLGFHGETRVSRKDFGLTWNQALETGGVLVGDEIRISLDIQAVKVDEEEEG